MPLPDQFIGQVRDDALGTTVLPWRACFHKWGNLSDFHRQDMRVAEKFDHRLQDRFRHRARAIALAR
ncbi:hypothetical protein GCM10027081_04040 [Cupriavidus yeoncheonensis]